MKYKLQTYQKNFLDFICGNPTNTTISGQDQEIEVRPSGTTQEEEVRIEESQDLKSGVVQKEEVQPKIAQDLRGGSQEEK